MAKSRGPRVRHLAVAVAVLALLAGCGLLGGKHDNAADAAPVVEQTAEPSTQPTTDEPATTPPTTTPPTTKPTPKKTKASKKPASTAPTEPPFWEQLPACAHKDSSKPVSMSKVKAALKDASGRVYWQNSAPSLKLNFPVVKAVAWMESGWQSNIHNCDGGAGVMQVMPDTLSFINYRFGQTYNVAKYQDNALAGANYLAWLTKWVGDTYFAGSYNLSTGKCKTTTSWCLLNVVISGYNAGQGSLEQAGASKKLPNPEYVATVRALMTRCKCDQY
jgi:soluble lytic murein transglycosylase-like protein